MIEIIVWPAFGALAGWVVWLLSGLARGPWGSVTAGAIGAICGGLAVVTHQPGPAPGVNIGSLFVAIACAVTVATLYVAVNGRTD